MPRINAQRSPSGRKAHLGAILLTAGVLLSACNRPEPVTRNDDPFERSNRQVHDFNVAFDKSLMRPTAEAYGTLVPEPVRNGISNFSSNAGLPGTIVNNLLQFRVGAAGRNTFRFLTNTTFGLAGILDPATDMGLPEEDTDFGETLHVWGVGEGAYVEIPFLGPSTVRDFAGYVIDIPLNPLGLSLDKPTRAYVVGAYFVSIVGDRYRYSDFVDSVLYESADSYTQAKLLYLQNRRFQLSGSSTDDAFDPYEDAYDPYAE